MSSPHAMLKEICHNLLKSSETSKTGLHVINSPKLQMRDDWLILSLSDCQQRAVGGVGDILAI